MTIWPTANIRLANPNGEAHELLIDHEPTPNDQIAPIG
jgi:hypothetical protein